MKRRILSLCLAVGMLPLTAQAYDAPRTVCETPCRHCGECYSKTVLPQKPNGYCVR